MHERERQHRLPKRGRMLQQGTIHVPLLLTFLLGGVVGALGTLAVIAWLRPPPARKPPPLLSPPLPLASTSSKALSSKHLSLRPLAKAPRTPSPTQAEPPTTDRSTPDAFGLTDALLLNGGGQQDINYFSHHLFLRMLHELLPKRGLPLDRLTLFSSDGENPEPDQMLSTSVPMAWLYEGLTEHQLIVPNYLVNTELKGHTLHAADKKAIQAWFQRFAQEAQKRLTPSTLFLFVTDHGTKGSEPKDNKIELWHQQLSVSELKAALAPIDPKNRVISVMSQCFSGGFADLMYADEGKIHGQRCGFFSTLADREAYGCFPETARSSRVGHAYHFVQALQTASTFEEAHRQVLLRDDAPDVPLATSDLYLRDRLRIAAKRKKRLSRTHIDRFLKGIWAKPPSFVQEEIVLLGKLQQTFGLPDHRSLKAVWTEIHQAREEQKRLQQIESIWQQVFTESRQGSLFSFYQKNPDFAAKIEHELQRDQIDEQTWKHGKELHRRYQAYLQELPASFERMKRLRERYDLVTKRSYALHQREAALLRVHLLLQRIAGRLYLHFEGTPEEKEDFEALLRCEQTALGSKTHSDTLLAEGPILPPSKEEEEDQKRSRQARSLTELQLRPARLGITFQPMPQGWNARYSRLAPGAISVTDVSEASPASRAGLRPGDVILAMQGKMLKLPNEIRDAVMLAPPKTPLTLTLYREGSVLHAKIRLDISPLPQAEEPSTELSDATPPPEPRSSAPRKPLPSPLKRPSAPTTLRSLQGEALPLPAPKGATLLFFWATWCEGCKALVPSLRSLYRDLSPKGLTFYAVTTDQPALLKPFLQEWGERFPFPVALEDQSQLTRRFRISTIPQIILLRPDNTVALHISIPYAGFEERLKQAALLLLQP